jgi:hypothetical protein
MSFKQRTYLQSDFIVVSIKSALASRPNLLPCLAFNKEHLNAICILFRGSDINIDFRKGLSKVIPQTNGRRKEPSLTAILNDNFYAHLTLYKYIYYRENQFKVYPLIIKHFFLKKVF